MIRVGIVTSFLVATASCAGTTGRQEIDLSGTDWQLKSLSWPSSRPAVAASVPGDINDALAAHINITRGDVYFGTNMKSKAVQDIAYQSWWLNKTFDVPASWSASRSQLVLEGIDYNATIFIGSHQLGASRGQYMSMTFDVTTLLRRGAPNEIAVLFHPPPKEFLDQWLAPGNAVQGAMYNYLDWWKSMVGMGYDFGQPLWTQGLLAPAKIIGTSGHDGFALSELAVLPSLSPPYSSASLQMSVVVESTGTGSAELVWDVVCMTNTTAAPASFNQVATLRPGRNELNITLHLDSPALWWPRGFGPQNLYMASLKVIDESGIIADNVSRTFGVRHLEETENAGPASWRYIEEFTCGPKDDPNNCTFPTADATPAEIKANRSWTFTINGRQVFARGTNWIPCNMMLGKCGKAEYAYLLRMAAESNHNYIRIWGGGGIEKEEFYDIADSLGIMVYQEMVHSQAMPVRDANFVAERVEVEQAVKRLRTHPSVVRYGWGNEFYGINRTSNRFERQFEEIANKLDGGRKATHGSPVTLAARHGPYCFYLSDVGPPGDPFPCFPSPGYAAYNEGTMNQEGANDPFEWDEFGAGGISSEFSLRRMIPAEHLFPLNASQADWVFHRAFDAVGAGPMWLGRDVYLPLFGEPSDLRHEIYASQFAQSEGLRYGLQAHRRKMPHRSMSAYWAFNEAWPNAAYGTVVEFAGPLKMAYYAGVKRPYAVTDVSLRYDQIAYPEGSLLPATVWCVSEEQVSFNAQVRATIVTKEGKVLGRREWAIQAGGASQGPGTSHQLGSLGLEMPAMEVATVVLLRLQLLSTSRHDVLSEEVYTFGVLPRAHPVGAWTLGARNVTAPPLIGLFTAPSVAVELDVRRASQGGFTATLANPSSAPALYVEVKALTKHIPEHEQFHPVVLSDNFVVIFGGEKLAINVELLSGFHVSAQAPDMLCATGWNLRQVCVSLPSADLETELIV